MAGAKGHQQAIRAWLETLTGPKRIVADSSIDVFNNIVVRLGMTEACYRLAFFLTEYLKFKHGITAEPIVGYVNDGTDELMISHAWVEYKGTKIDLSLAITEAHASGGLIILDQVLIPGQLQYSYHRMDTDASRLRIEAEVAADPRWRSVMERKGAEHALMLELVETRQSRLTYLNNAPDGMDFPTMCHMAG